MKMKRCVNLLKNQFPLSKMEIDGVRKKSLSNGDVNMNNVKLLNYVNHSQTPQIVSVIDAHAVAMASDRLHSGDVIALPTDTVYGLACSANDPHAIQKLYKIKGRDEEKPVAICVSSIAQLKHWSEATHLSNELLTRLLPGAVTIVLNKSKNLNNPFLNPGIQKIGIRIPDAKFIQQVSAAFIAPIALTSANKSGTNSTLDVYEFRDLWPELGAVFDGGHLGDAENDMKQRCASTVVDLSVPDRYEIIRNGIAVEHTVGVMNDFGIQCC